MIKTMLGAAGTPGLAVETVPALREVRVGEVLDGVVEIEGGVAALHIARVTLDLVVRALIHPDPRRADGTEDGERPEPHHGLIMIAAETIATDLTLDPGQLLALPFAIEIPAHAPLSLGVSTAGLRTRVEVNGAQDGADGDAIRILPDRWTGAVLDAMEHLDFRLAEAEVEHVPGDPCPFFQTFVFRPMSLRDLRVECVDIAFRPRDHGVHVDLVVDNRGSLFTAAREGRVGLDIDDELLDMGANAVADLLREEIDRLKGPIVA
ncbi:sporulation protein (plasmid) [Tistrella mobilis]|uniref:sporulation protein n=1 Tax=Tistrella mobilis TaxID=171437 RepID=UPI003558CF12